MHALKLACVLEAHVEEKFANSREILESLLVEEIKSSTSEISPSARRERDGVDDNPTEW